MLCPSQGVNRGSPGCHAPRGKAGAVPPRPCLPLATGRRGNHNRDMSKSLKRVQDEIAALGLDLEIRKMTQPTNTAAQAADAVGAEIDQIVKSVIFLGRDSGKVVLFLTPGGQRVDMAAAGGLAGEALGKADAACIRRQTGFAIGGVSPFGHASPIRSFMEPRLLDFPLIWAAAGTPHHLFAIAPRLLAEKTGAHVAPFAESG